MFELKQPVAKFNIGDIVVTKDCNINTPFIIKDINFWYNINNTVDVSYVIELTNQKYVINENQLYPNKIELNTFVQVPNGSFGKVVAFNFSSRINIGVQLFDETDTRWYHEDIKPLEHNINKFEQRVKVTNPQHYYNHCIGKVLESYHDHVKVSFTEHYYIGGHLVDVDNIQQLIYVADLTPLS